ncbi:MAG: hypothetical protein KAH21_09000, partial [Spirochaetaceae bacterium]|nr:hypothetical protein [Spirochaetaceae bacterium]
MPAIVLMLVSIKINSLPRVHAEDGVLSNGVSVAGQAWASPVEGTARAEEEKPLEQREVTDWKQSIAGIPQTADMRLNRDKEDSKGHKSSSTSLSEAAVEAQGSGSSAAGASLSSKNSPPKKPSKANRSAKKQDSSRPEEKKLPASSQASSMSNGSAGRGSTPAVYNTWSQNESTGDEGQSVEAEDEDVEDREESSRNRGGIQPHLKDRTESPNRELNIGGAKGDKPGTGRGGPGPTKKSRGTASLVLGTAVPDFVKGKMGPGVNKVIQERSRPQIEAGQHGANVDAQASDMPDTPVENAAVSSDYRELVREYLIRLHGGELRINS